VAVPVDRLAVVAPVDRLAVAALVDRLAVAALVDRLAVAALVDRLAVAAFLVGAAFLAVVPVAADLLAGVVFAAEAVDRVVVLFFAPVVAFPAPVFELTLFELTPVFFGRSFCCC
jgi:hypothetical protein